MKERIDAARIWLLGMQELEENHQVYKKVADLLGELQARLEQAEKDAARIDWMDKVGRVSIERVREGHVKGPMRWDVEFGYEDDCAKSKKGMRAAIDAAMKA